MAPKEYAPDPRLASLVKCYWTTQRHFLPPANTFQILPDRYIEVIFCYGAPAYVVTPASCLPLPSLYLVHLLEHPLTLRFDGLITIVAARLYGWALDLLVTQPTTSTALPITSLEETFSQLSAQLTTYLQNNQPQQAVQCLETILLERFQRQLPLQQRQAQLLNHLLNQAQLPCPAALAEQFALSVRQVERLVKTASGITPKLLTRLVRFEQARDRLWQQPRSNLTALAYEIGYADQAHFSRDFKVFSGQSPRAFMRQVRQWQA